MLPSVNIKQCSSFCRVHWTWQQQHTLPLLFGLEGQKLSIDDVLGMSRDKYGWDWINMNGAETARVGISGVSFIHSYSPHTISSLCVWWCVFAMCWAGKAGSKCQTVLWKVVDDTVMIITVFVFDCVGDDGQDTHQHY